MKRPTVPRSRHTVLVRRWNHIAKGGLWLAAGLTLTVLILIIGYILINGFYTRSTEQDPVASLTDEIVTVGGRYPNVEFSVVVNRSLRLRDLAYDDVRDIYSGENNYWGFLTGQDRGIEAALWSGDSRFTEALADYLVLEDGGFAESLSGVRSIEEIQSYLEQSSGAVVIAPDDCSR